MMKFTCISNRLAEINFHNQYCSGVRNFSQAKLDKVNLSNKILSELDLRQANIAYSTLENIKLSDSDLSKSKLINVNFKASSINNVIFDRADLTNSKLSLSKISNASFFGACLYKASFCGAKVDNLDFSFANLSAAYLKGLDLSNSMLEGAIYSCDTLFPMGFDPIEAGMMHESSMLDLDKIISQFDSVYQRAKTCLGETITNKYFNSSRPEHDWLNKLEANNKSQIVFKSDKIESFSDIEAEYIRQWMIMFASLCSKIVKNVRDDQELFSDFSLS